MLTTTRCRTALTAAAAIAAMLAGPADSAAQLNGQNIKGDARSRLGFQRSELRVVAAGSGADMHNLLAATAVLEGTTGLALVALPSQLATLLLGSSLDAPAALTLARVAGVALVALAVTCWLARHDGQSRAARGLVGAMVLYHTGVAIVLAYANIGLAVSGIGLWPTVLFHAAMTAWCVTTLR